MDIKEKSKISNDQPLSGKRIIITRAQEQGSDFADQLSKYGARPIYFPTIKIIPMESYHELDQSIQKLASYHWIVFTSVNGVKYFLARLNETSKDIKTLEGLKIAAIGTKTAHALKKHGIKVDLVPREYRAEGILEEMKQEGVSKKKVLIPRAEYAREILPRELKKWGAEVDVVAVYRTIKPSLESNQSEKLLKTDKIDVITFTSPSTVNNFVEILGSKGLQKLLKGSLVASIGPITKEAAEKWKIRTHIMPAEYTINALVEAIVAFYERHKV